MSGILFVTQVPIDGFATVSMAFANHDSDPHSVLRGGDLWLRYSDGKMRNLTEEAGFGNTGFQGDGGIAVRDPTVHWSGLRAIFSMLVGSSHWQLYEVSGLEPGQKATIQKIDKQPDYNNVAPFYGTDDRILFVSDRPRDGQHHLYPQVDEYEGAPSTTGIFSLDPATGELSQIEWAPSGAFDPIIDSAGRIVFTKWDHLKRDQQADRDRFGHGDYGAFDYSDETANARILPLGPETFPEPQSNADPEAKNGPYTTGGLNQFFPWQMNEDGSAEETLNHVGRHEIGGSYAEGSIKGDSNLNLPIPQSNHANTNLLEGDDGLFRLREDPKHPGLFYATNIREFGPAKSGQIVTLTGPDGMNADQMVLSWITDPVTKGSPEGTAPPNHSGHYRDPLPLSSGELIAVHTAETRPNVNEGTSTVPKYRYDFRLKRLKKNGSYFVAAAPLTSGISKSVSWKTISGMGHYDGNLWELNPVELKATPRPARHSTELEGPERQAFVEASVDEQKVRDWLRANNLALIVSRNVTARDRNDTMQPYNLQVPGGVKNAPKSGTIYEAAYLQLLEGALLRGYKSSTARRVLAKPLLDDRNLAKVGGPPASVRITLDGSMAALVPARRPVVWQLTDSSGNPMVRERNWISFQPGEIRSCPSCHGINTTDQSGNPTPTNKPQALVNWLRSWKAMP